MSRQGAGTSVPAPLAYPGGCVAGACGPDRSPAAARPARPLAVRAASFARRVGSKPGQAPQASRRPPIGRGLSLVCCRLASAAALGHRSLAPRSPRRPSHLWGLVCWRVVRRVGSLSGQAPPPTGVAPRSPAVPSVPSGALHTGGARFALISHVIPMRLFQDLNCVRWYFNVFGASRKMTRINYVRVFWGVGA